MGRRTRECYLCGETYEYCPTCSQDKLKPTWMVEFHSVNCKEIFDICTRYNMQMLTKEKAMVALEKCDLSNKDSFKACVQRDLANIFAQEPKSKTAIKKTEAHEVVNKIKEE